MQSTPCRSCFAALDNALEPCLIFSLPMGETVLITNKTGKTLLSFAALLYLGLLDCCLLMYFDRIDPLKQNGIFPILSWLKFTVVQGVV
jgi:hypothetical protein